MANTKIDTTNHVAAATLKNGTGGGAPALDETLPYGMANLLTSDRYTIWKTASTPSASPVLLDLDLGSDKATKAVAVLGYRRVGASAVTTVTVKSAASASGYVPGAWTTQGTFSLSANPRDNGCEFSSVSHRYWRLEFAHGGSAWSAGRIWIGSPTDLGAIHSPGGLYAPHRNRLETPLPSGATVLQDLGDPGADFTLPWNSIESSLRTTLQALADATGSFLLVDPDGNFFEVFMRNGRVPVVRQFSSLFDINLEMARLS